MHEIDLEKQFSISQLHAYSNRNELETLFLLSKKKLERSEERNTPTRQIDTRICTRGGVCTRDKRSFSRKKTRGKLHDGEGVKIAAEKPSG